MRAICPAGHVDCIPDGRYADTGVLENVILMRRRIDSFTRMSTNEDNPSERADSPVIRLGKGVMTTLRYAKNRIFSVTCLAILIVLLSVSVNYIGLFWNVEIPQRESWIIARAADDNVVINETMIGTYEMSIESGLFGRVTVAEGQCFNGITEACQYMQYSDEYSAMDLKDAIFLQEMGMWISCMIILIIFWPLLSDKMVVYDS